MSQLEVDKIVPQSGTTLTIGDSGDTINFADGQNINIDSNTLYIDSTNNRVGIGTTSPSNTLDVVGGFNLSGNLFVDTNVLATDVTNNRVGINVSSPTRTLHIDASGGANVEISRTGQDALYLETDGTNANIRTTSATGALRFQTNGNNERMRITSSGDVFIGDSNPAYSSRLTVSGNGSADTGLFMYDGTAGTYLNITTNGANGVVDLEANARTGSYPPLTFSVSTAERMRISGNTVMIGKTSNGIANDGVELKTNDVSRFTQTSRNVIEINRKTDDGDIVQFKKDGTTVGSIASNSGSIELDSQGSSLKFSHLGTNLAFLLNTNFAPNADNAMDLGASSERFKDIYLGGGAYLGGTGSANKLEDYEEGTWTGTISDGTNNATMGSNTGSYIKIGSLVFVAGYFTITSLGSVSGNVRLTGLPFACGSSNSFYTGNGGGWGANLNITDDTSIGFQIDTNASHMNISNWDNVSGTTNLQASELSANGQFMLNLTYRTDA